MKCKQELEFLAQVAQDYINKQDRSAQIALATMAQQCVNAIESALQDPIPTPEELAESMHVKQVDSTVSE